jgi:cobalt-zinc-cadmium efflux system outer membrane protein
MHSIALRAVVAFVLTVSALHAEPGLVITLSGVGDRVRAQNPDLAAARLRIREALGRKNQSGRLQNPELGFELSHDERFRSRAAEISFSQRFPLTNRLQLEKSVSATAVKVAEAEVREVERQLVAKAKEGIVGVLAVRQKRDLLKSQVDVSQSFADSLSESAAKGEASALDAGQAKLEAAGIGMALRQLDAEEAAMVGTLKPLLGMLPGEGLLVTGTLGKAAIPGTAPDPSARPDFQAAVLEIRAAGQGVALEQSKRREDVEAGIFFSAARDEDAPEGYDREGMVGLRFTLPLPLWNKNEGAIEEAQAREERLKKEATALGRGIRLEAEAAAAEMTQWLKLVEDTEETLLPLAGEQTTAAEDAYRKGQGELAHVFRSRERLVQLQASRLDALRQFHLARVRYEAALAQP